MRHLRARASYRFAGAGALQHLAGRFADPLAEFGVQIFFVISGFIITALMLRESGRTGAVSISAFYARRCFRILPPLLLYYATLAALTATGRVKLTWASFAASATFTCNVGLVECDWWVAHTWSLAVEEQFYLGWPLIFPVLPSGWRVRALGVLLVSLLIGSALQPPTFHSNFTSFACLTCGALLATSPAALGWCTARPRPLAWLAAGAMIVGAPLVGLGRPTAVVLPVLIAFFLFAGTVIGWVRAVLVSAPLQWIGLTSYSLYLWQQLFLARPSLYPAGVPSVLLLPVAAVGSYWLVERPFVRVGHRLSRRFKARQEQRLGLRTQAVSGAS